MKICAIIPAKENSKRFNKKNYHEVDGWPMFYHSVLLCQNSKYIKDVYVVTDSDFIEGFCFEKDVNIIQRGDNIRDDEQPYIDVLRYAYMALDKSYDYIVSVLANSIGHDKLDEAIEKIIEDSSISEVRGFDKYGSQSGLFVFKSELIKNSGATLHHMASVFDNGREIHYENELYD
jgi:CMP-N-acetylneuraminic acid synthetase